MANIVYHMKRSCLNEKEKTREGKEKTGKTKGKIEEKKLDKIKSDMKEKLDELSPAMINLVLSTPNICPVVTCAYKFKKGKSKGENCQCKKIHQDGLCKFHYRKHKIIWKKRAKLENVNKKY